MNVCAFGAANAVGALPGIALWTAIGAALSSVDAHEKISPVMLLSTWSLALLLAVAGGALAWWVGKRLAALRGGESSEVGEVKWALVSS